MAFQIDSGVEVRGDALRSITVGLRNAPSIAKRYLVKFGLVSEGGELDPARWYPMDLAIQACHAIAKDVGPTSTYMIGMQIPELVVFPPDIIDIESALRSLDIGFHMSHRKDGLPMFDPSTGRMLDGIGHYQSMRTPGEKKITCVCENPYPCDLDHGIVTAMAQRFERRASVVHDDKKPCRKRGASQCTFVVTW